MMTGHSLNGPQGGRRTARFRAGIVHIGVAIALAGFILALYYPLLFTNRVLASGDILLYFYPYRDYAAATLRNGEIPLWNPYIFLGVPFLANPQAAVLYPLHWPLSWAPVTSQVYWSAALHTWLLGYGGYLLLRRWEYSASAGLVTGLLLAGSGFYGGLLGHLNQMNGAAWLPWGFWILAGTLQSGDSPAHRLVLSKIRNLTPKICGFALLVALMLLAGHTQTTYINLFGLGLWAVWPLASSLVRDFRFWNRRKKMHGAGSIQSPKSEFSRVRRLLVYIAGVLLGVLLAAAQLLPTLELSSLGLRAGGLSYQEATAFSLKLLRLPWTLLPSYGLADLGAVFDTPGYSEYIAYVGLFGLVLAALGAWRGTSEARPFGLLFAALGLFLALGRWNPVYFILYTVAPGFDLFRNPARWMMLYTMGMAVLAGAGVEYIRLRLKGRADSTRLFIFHIYRLPLVILFIILFVALDLLLAACALPHAQTTAPQAVYDVRTAPAHLLSDPVRTTLHPAAMGRFLGMSTITYDPGDMADWRHILLAGRSPQIDAQAFEQFIIALKVQELLAPNLSLLWRLPAVDGFDGGVLPLERYNHFLTLFIPQEELVPDGRLREQLRRTPPANLLKLLNVQYLITDKLADLWFEDVYYDRQFGARLRATGPVQISLAPSERFEATHVDLIAFIEGDDAALAGLARQNVAVAEVSVAGMIGARPEGATTAHFTLTAGGQAGADLADPALDSPLAASGGAVVAYRDMDNQRQEYRARLSLTEPVTPVSITVQRSNTPFTVTVQAVTLFDARTQMFAPLLPSDQGRFHRVHSGDVKIYENLDVLPRAYLVHEAVGAENAATALELLRSGQIEPGRQAVVEGGVSFASTSTPGDHATITAYAPERVEIDVHTAEQALLVLSDTAFPGWVAAINGEPAPIHTANYLFRGVSVPPGEHTVVFAYQPASWRRGLWLSAVGGVLCLALLSLGLRRRPVPS